MIPTGAKNRRQRARAALEKAIRELIDHGWSHEAMGKLVEAFMTAKITKVL